MTRFIEKTTLLTLVLGFGALTFSSTAESAENPRIVRFEKLDAVDRGDGTVEVEYQLTEQTWERLAKSHAQLRLDLFVAKDADGRVFEFARSRPLYEPAGRVAFEADTFGQAVQLAVGDRASKHAMRVALQDRLGQRIRLPLAHAARQSEDTEGYDPQRLDRWRASVESACRRVTRFARDRAQCLSLVNQLAHRATATSTVRACASATDHTDALFSCLRDASSLRQDPAPVVDACRTAVSGSGQLGRCLQEAAKVERDPESIISQCAEDSDSVDETVLCVRRHGEEASKVRSLAGGDVSARQRALELRSAIRSGSSPSLR